MTDDPDATAEDQAARAAWLYYLGGMTQDQIARAMGVSRQRAQRLTHRLAGCLTLEAALRDRYGLHLARVAPGLGPGSDPLRAIASVAAGELERVLREPGPLTIALGTGRALRALVEAMGLIDAPQHRFVSLIGNIAPDGSASYFDVIMRIAEKVKAPHYPMPTPVVCASAAENAAFQALAPVRRVRELAQAADVTFVGVGQMGADAPLHMDGFLTAAELAEVQAAGAVGEMAGWIYDSAGRYMDLGLSARVGGVRVEPRDGRPVIAVAGGPAKVPAIAAALKSGLVNGLVTDEDTARAILSR